MDKTTYQNQLKSLYFTNKSKQKKTTPVHFKDTSTILKNISKKRGFSKIKERSLLHLVLKKILLKNQLEWISYSYVNKNKLIIFAKNHIAQSELNYQKDYLLKCLNTVTQFSELDTVSILRDKNYNINKTNKATKKFHFKEKSYGIFDNHVTNQRLSGIIEKIREKIININP